MPSKNLKRCKRTRTCRIEELEGREMLSVTPWALVDNVSLTTESQSTDCDSVAALVQNVPTLTPVAALSAITDFRCTNKTETSITLEWHDNNETTTSYEFRWRAGGGVWNTKTVNEAQITITGLLHSSEYAFQVRGVSAGGETEWMFLSATTLIRLSRPTIPEVFATAPTIITVNWKVVSNASGYTIQYATNTGYSKNVGTLNVSGGEATTADITGLKTNTKYYVRVMATGTGDYSNSVYSGNWGASTKSPTAPKLRLTAITATSVTLEWIRKNGLTSYTLEYKKLTDSDWTTWTPIPESTVAEAKITGLTTGTTYEFRLTAMFGTNPLSSVIRRTPVVTPVRPAKVKKVAQVNSVTLSWAAEPRNDAYIVSFWRSVGKLDHLLPDSQVTIGSTGAVITGLQPGKKYVFGICAKNGESYSTWVGVKVTTLKYVAPKKVGRVDKPSLGTVSFRWKDSTAKGTPTGKDVIYEVGIYDAKTKTYLWNSAAAAFAPGIAGLGFVGTEKTVTLTGLSSKKYTFCVRAIAVVYGDTIESKVLKINVKW